MSFRYAVAHERLMLVRSLKRNQSLVYYAEYGGEIPILDEDGYDTGEKEPIYDTPKPLRIHVSAAKGNAYTSIFGSVVDYTKVLGPADDMTLPINEQTVFWIDTSDTSAPHDYIVKRVAKGLNAIHYAVQKVR